MEKIERILNYFHELFPNAQCELNHKNSLELLIAVMLSAQTTDDSVNKLTNKLFEKYRSIDDYINVDIKELQSDLRSIGLYRNKASNIKKMVNSLKTNFNSIVPNTQEELESLAGVGRKTANVVMSVAFGEQRIAVDTHVERVSKRLYLAFLNDSVLNVEKKLMKKIPENLWSDTHHKMIFFGRYHCTARNPNCVNCKLKDICRYYKHNRLL